MLAVILLCSCGSPATTKPTSSPTPTPTPSPIASATTTSIPLGRWAAAMTYDQARHNVVLFGGLAGQTPLDDTWTWNGTSWAHHQGLTANPAPRRGAAMAYDEINHQVILFGGLGANGALDDTWSWDGAAWRLLHPAHTPPKREGASMTYDPVLNSIVLYGGMNVSTAMPSAINDTWQWSGGDWAPLRPTQSPAGGVRPRLAFLTGANLVERFGDCIESHDNNLYAFDGHTWTARQPSGNWPPALCIPSFAGDPQRHVLVLFGGSLGTGVSPPPADTWVFDGSSWSKEMPAQIPPARYDAPMVYDTDHHLMVLFGGQGLGQGQSGPLNDTWTWDGTSWTSH